MKTVYRIPKEFAVNEVALFKDSIYEKISQDTLEIELDFTDCTFIDSTGLGAIVSIFKRLNEKNGQLTLLHLQPFVKEMFVMTRLDQVLNIK